MMRALEWSPTGSRDASLWDSHLNDLEALRKQLRVVRGIRISGVVVEQIVDRFILKNKPCLDDDERRGPIVKAPYARERVVANEYHERGWCGKPGALLHFVVRGLEHLNRGLLGLRVVAHLESARALHIVLPTVPVVVAVAVATAAAAREQRGDDGKKSHAWTIHRKEQT